MSLTKKIEAEISTWEKTIAVHQKRISNCKEQIKQLRRLLGMAEGIESE